MDQSLGLGLGPKEHRLVHDKDNIMWGNEHEQSITYESAGPVTQAFVVSSMKDK